MIIGNQEAIKTLKTYIEVSLNSGGDKPAFFLLEGPEHIGKSTIASELSKEKLGQFFFSDFHEIKDCSAYLGKKHNIPVEMKSSNQFIELPEGKKYENWGTREMNSRFQQASFGPCKILLIENINRMNGEAINAFLKTCEEPLPKRIIIATIPHHSQTIDTILSRAVLIRFQSLSPDEMNTFAQQEQLFPDNLEMQALFINMAMGKPGYLKSLAQKISENVELQNTFLQLTSLLKDPKSPKFKKQSLLKQLSEFGFLDAFLDGRIAYTTEHDLFTETEKWLKVKKMLTSNVSIENLLWYGVL